MTAAVVVTGSSGRLGAALCGRLTASGMRVIGVDLTPGPHTTEIADLVSGDVTASMEGAAAVVHCAALHAPHRARFSAEAFHRVNVVATERLLDAATRAGVGRFVFTSTTSVYGRSFDEPDAAAWVDETLATEPRDVYDESKLAAEQLVEGAHTGAMSTLTLRVARCFPEPPRSLVVNRLYRGVDVTDVVDALTAAVHVPVDRHHCLNVAGPRVFERHECERLRTDTERLIEEKLPWVAAGFRSRGWALPESIDRVYVSDAAAEVLGYRPRYGVRHALAQVADPT